MTTKNYFKEGAELVGNNPKSPWISVKRDLPCNHSELISPDKSSENLTVRSMWSQRFMAIKC